MPTPIRIVFLIVVVASSIIAWNRLRESVVARSGAALWLLSGIAWSLATFGAADTLVSPEELRTASFIGFGLGGFMVARAASTYAGKPLESTRNGPSKP